MKKVLVIAVAASAFLVSCLKNNVTTPPTNNCTNVTPAAEQATIQAFTNADSIDYTRDTSNVYFHVVDSGSGPVVYSTIFFKYKATLLNGTVISQSSQITSSPVVNLI